MALRIQYDDPDEMVIEIPQPVILPAPLVPLTGFQKLIKWCQVMISILFIVGWSIFIFYLIQSKGPH